MSDYIYTSDGELYHADELCHYGVPGMKWGRRKARPLTDVQKARRNVRDANKAYKKSFNKAYNRAAAAYSPFKKHRVANERRWNDAMYKAEKLREAKGALKDAKKSAKAAKKAATKAAVKDYDKAYDTAIKSQDKADRKWSDVQSQYKSLGKTRVTRALKATYGKSDAVKKYRQEYDNWEKTQNTADDEWRTARKKYKKTGKTNVSRLANNIRYGK